MENAPYWKLITLMKIQQSDEISSFWSLFIIKPVSMIPVRKLRMPFYGNEQQKGRSSEFEIR